jgi:hypothetical protein
VVCIRQEPPHGPPPGQQHPAGPQLHISGQGHGGGGQRAGAPAALPASSGKQSDYNTIQNIYLSASDPSEKSRALAALAYAVLPSQTNATLEFAIGSQVRSQDSGSLITRIAYQGGDRLQAAWNFVRTRYKDISEKLGGEDEAANAMGKLVRNVASRLAGEKSIAEVEAVFEAHSEFLTEKRLLEGAKESISANQMWNKRNGRHVCEWLDRQP